MVTHAFTQGKQNVKRILKNVNMKTTTALVHDHHGRDYGQVEIRVTIGRKVSYFATGVKCRRSDFVAGKVVNALGADELNRRLAMLYGRVCSEVNAALEANEAVDVGDIRRKVWRVMEDHSGEPVVIDWINGQLPLLNVSAGTLKHYKPLVSRLEAFGEIRQWRDVTTESITRFDAFLHGVKPALSDAAIYNYHKCLKAMLNRADRFGKIDRNPYERLKGRFSRGEKESVEYMTEDELRRLEELELPEKTEMAKARDLFVFQAYTGLSYSDAQAFDMDLYKRDGKRWVFVGRRIKTGVPFVSVLLPPVVGVLERYGMQVPALDNHVYNRNLKALGVMAGIRTKMHSHLARHTFATMMLRNGAKIENVSRMLGHTNIRQTMRYAKVLAESVMDDFEMLEGKLNKKGSR